MYINEDQLSWLLDAYECEEMEKAVSSTKWITWKDGSHEC